MNDLKYKKSNDKSKQVYTQGNNGDKKAYLGVFRQEKPPSLLKAGRYFFWRRQVLTPT